MCQWTIKKTYLKYCTCASDVHTVQCDSNQDKNMLYKHTYIMICG